ncbi:unnamed protein product [Aphanomyces euteiches]|nr:hypothetical protein AeRB84_012940 [Aphanomyces euteiches]
MKYESAAPRYDFRFLGNGNVEVQMPHPNRKGYGMQVVFLALCIFGGLCLVYSMYPYLEPFIPLLLLDSLMTVAICASIADAMFGFELIEVTNASFSHTRNYGCRKKTKHYDITQMGPLKAHVSQMYDSDDSSRVVGTRTQLGFRKSRCLSTTCGHIFQTESSNRSKESPPPFRFVHNHQVISLNSQCIC